MTGFDSLEHNLRAAGIIQPDGIHSELKSGMHGQEIDFDLVVPGTPLYKQWVDRNVDTVETAYPDLPAGLISVANGTNNLTKDVAKEFKGRLVGLLTEKDPNNRDVVRLTEEAEEKIKSTDTHLWVILENVVTTGSSAAMVAREVLKLTLGDVEVLSTWQRRPELPALRGIAHRTIIDKPEQTYTPEECLDHGFCADKWELIPRKRA